MATFRHNKKRNTGLVYEVLVRRLSETMVGQDREGYRRALEISRKYFSPGAILGRQKELFDVVRSTRGVSMDAARRILAAIRRESNGLDRRALDIKKSNLIKEVNHAFGREVYSQYRIPDYRLLATIQMYLDLPEQPCLTESIQTIHLEEALVAHMSSAAEPAAAPPSREAIDALVMAMAAKRFSEKYNHSLNGPQKRLLERYIRFQVTGDERPLKEHIAVEHHRISAVLARAVDSPEVRADPIMLKRLEEARHEWDHNQTSELNAGVEKVMMYQKLAEEIESDERAE